MKKISDSSLVDTHSARLIEIEDLPPQIKIYFWKNSQIIRIEIFIRCVESNLN